MHFKSEDKKAIGMSEEPLGVGLPGWFLKAYGALAICVYLLIVLGGTVRVMKAGLACPDWPLCFGKMIPDFQPQVYFEFIHRVLAGSVVIATLFLQSILLRSRVPRHLKLLAAGSILLLFAQILFGGLTVLLSLRAYVVVTHLLLGTAFFSILFWIYMTLQKSTRAPGDLHAKPAWLPWFSGFVVCVVYGQILLGGLVASNFASLVCTGFPKCNGQWFPTFSGLIGLHIIHRLGAYAVFAVASVNLLIMRRLKIGRLKKLSAMIFFKVCGQLGLGIANVLLFTPPLIAIAHLALGVAILSFAFRQLHFSMGLR